MSLKGAADRRHWTHFSKSGCFRQNFQWIFATCGADFGEFWAHHLKSRLQLNHVPVHKTYSVKVTKMTTTS